MDNYTIRIEKTDTGFSAYFEEIPLVTTGSTMAELFSNLKEAFELYESL